MELTSMPPPPPPGVYGSDGQSQQALPPPPPPQHVNGNGLAPQHVSLTVNPVASSSFTETEDDSEVPPPPSARAASPGAAADTHERRMTATQAQNDAQWARMQEEAGDDLDDIAPYFPKANIRTLRPSMAQRANANPMPPPADGSSSSSSSTPATETIPAAEWDAAAKVARHASPSQSFLSSQEQAQMLQLPKQFAGANKLIMPAYLTGQISNVTLPSRLDLLGRRGFKLLGAINPRRCGNAVLGWSPVITTSWTKREWRIRMQLFLLPRIFSKSMAKILLFLRFVIVALLIIILMDVTGVATANPGRVWAIGVLLALIVMYHQSNYRRAPDGVMAFCRSMGVPDVEEYMFSYCWKVEPDTVRTLAKAVWKAGVGVWIDVVKLCPGDEIRPMVVVFLCQEYCDSMNCCVEMMEAVQHPEKVTICIIKNNIHPQVMKFLIGLKAQGLRMCVGFDELMQMLDLDLQDMTDIAAFQWWRSQSISGAGVPDRLVPSNWPMARFSLKGRVILPEKSVDVGPLYISGDCQTTGQSLALPWLLFVALIAVGINAYDFWDKWVNNSFLHTDIDYVFLGVIAACNCAPFLGFSYLLDRRRDCHVSLRPLLASRSMGKDGIKVRVIGHPDDPIYVALRAFLTKLGHLAPDLPADAAAQEAGSSTPLSPGGLHPVPRKEPRCVTVFIMENIARRDEMFGSSSKAKSAFDNRFSLFIWSGSQEAKKGMNPFTDDEIGQRLMRYLVLVVDWEKHGLCESLFSAIGVRVVDILHEKPSKPTVGIAGSGGTSMQMFGASASAAALAAMQARQSVFGMASVSPAHLGMSGLYTNSGSASSSPVGSFAPGSNPLNSFVPGVEAVAEEDEAAVAAQDGARPRPQIRR